MKLTFATLAACAGLFLSGAALAAGSTPEFSPFAGGRPESFELHRTLYGKPVTIVQIRVSYHQMNLPPLTAQPIGFRKYYYVLKGKRALNAARCEKWVEKVQKDEAAYTKASPTFPYFEINLAQGAKPLTVGGLDVFKEADVQCWEALDLGPPVF
jgi:hypothetical protein